MAWADESATSCPEYGRELMFALVVAVGLGAIAPQRVDA